VSCLRTEGLLRHGVVPARLRSRLPESAKSRSSRDIVQLCTGCHAQCNKADDVFERQLREAVGVPTGAGSTPRSVKVDRYV
jgi:hypothetical protein